MKKSNTRITSDDVRVLNGLNLINPSLFGNAVAALKSNEVRPDVLPGQVLRTTYAVSWGKEAGTMEVLPSPPNSKTHLLRTYLNPWDVESGRHVPVILKLMAGKPLPVKKLGDAIEELTLGKAEGFPCRVTHMTKPYGIALTFDNLLGWLDIAGYFVAVQDNLAKGLRLNHFLENLKQNPPPNRDLTFVRMVMSNTPDASDIKRTVIRDIKDTSAPVKLGKVTARNAFFSVCAADSPHDFDVKGFIDYDRLLHKIADAARPLYQHWLTDEVIDNFPTDSSRNWMEYLTDILRQKIYPQLPEPVAPVFGPEAPQHQTKTSHEPYPAREGTRGQVPKPPKPPKQRPPALLNGLDAKALLEEVLKSPQGFYECETEGPQAIEIILPKDPPPEPTGKKRGPRKEKEKKLHEVDLEESAVRSKLAVMEWNYFRTVVENRRYAGEWRLKGLLGHAISLDRGNTFHIGPERIGEIPALVAGAHQPGSNRLYVVCITYPAEKGEEERKLAICPSGWLRDITETWIAALFGTKWDPTILDWCDAPPLPEWWAKLREYIPTQQTQTPLNVRALLPAPPSA